MTIVSDAETQPRPQSPQATLVPQAEDSQYNVRQQVVAVRTSRNNATTTRRRTACFSCRSAKQRCDRMEPCINCATHNRPCTYPSVSHRGRKTGSSNKPDTVEKLLLRIKNSRVGEQVVKAILDSAHTPRSSSSTSTLVPTPESGARRAGLRRLDPPPPPPPPTTTTTTITAGEHHFATLPQGPCLAGCSHTAEPRPPSSMVCPLDILAAAVAAVSGSEREDNDHEAEPPHPTLVPPLHSSSHRWTAGASSPASSASVDSRLVRYFASPSIASLQKDWQVLAGQAVESIFKLEASACDPIAARLIDESDAHFFFGLFFKIRNPLVSLLDPELHTPEYVYRASFTLFSVICALGCAVSARPRDRVISAALLSLAEGNMQWSMAVSVRSLETLQAIVLMQYWAPMRNRRCDESYWLHLGYATQLAREIGIDNPDSVDKHFKASDPVLTGDARERHRRNYERTWLYIFIADKSFGVVSGRRLCVSWDEMPPGAFDWWRKPMTSPHDRMISGIVETRGILLSAFGARKGGDAVTLASVSDWHTRWFEALEHVRRVRCAPDALPSSRYLSILAFYMDHSILVLNAQAMREMQPMASGDDTMLELREVYRKTVNVATRVLDIVLADPMMNDLRLGFHNNQFIMICHAVAEIVQACKKNMLSPQVAADATSKVRAIPEHLERIAHQLPATSVARLYASLSRSFVNQLDRLSILGKEPNAPSSSGPRPVVGLQDALAWDWWTSTGNASPEGSGTGFGGQLSESLSLEQLVFDMGGSFPVANGEGLHSFGFP